MKGVLHHEISTLTEDLDEGCLVTASSRIVEQGAAIVKVPVLLVDVDLFGAVNNGVQELGPLMLAGGQGYGLGGIGT
jgi:hypothetical protein